MYINYEYYRVFYYAAKCGNLTKAAALLQNSQPNLTRAIKTLEAELGCTLFSRTNRGLILTPEGEALYRHIRVAFAEIEAGEAAVTQSRTLERGSVFLAAGHRGPARNDGGLCRRHDARRALAVADADPCTADPGGAGLRAGVCCAARAEGCAGRPRAISAHYARRRDDIAQLLCCCICPARRGVPARDRGSHRRPDHPDGRGGPRCRYCAAGLHPNLRSCTHD